MSSIPTVSQSVIAGKLKKSKFKTEQERLEAYAETLSISAQAGKNGSDGLSKVGPAGPAGSPPTTTTTTKDITLAATSLDTEIQLEDAIVNLVNFSGGAPGMYILGVSGTIVYFSAGAPANHKVKITKFDSTP